MSSNSKKPITGTTRTIGTSRLPPLPGSRSGTPVTHGGGGSSSNRGQSSTTFTQQQQQQQQKTNLMKQNLLDKDRKMAEYSVSSGQITCLLCWNE